jgi:hypothetical protein
LISLGINEGSIGLRQHTEPREGAGPRLFLSDPTGTRGFDISGEGIAAASKAAGQAGVKTEAIQHGRQEFDFGTEKWGLIVLSYARVPISNPEFIQRLCRPLRPGSFVVYEGHMADASATPGIWPKPNELVTVFQSELRILPYEDVKTFSDWRRQGKTRVVRLLAKK